MRAAIWVVLVIAVLGTGMGKRNTHLMGVTGDSISAAAMADIPLPDPFHVGSRQEDQRKWVRFFIEHKNSLSWASGRKVDSHYERLKAHYSRLSVANVSVSGAKSKAVPAQVDELLKVYRKKKFEALPYVTLLIGANDACGGLNPEDPDFTAQQLAVEESLAKLAGVKQDIRMRVLVAGPPMIPDLGKEEIRKSRTLFGITCEYMRDNWLKTCGKLVKWKNEAEYMERVEVVNRLNSALSRAASQAAQAFPNLEVIYSDSLARFTIDPDMLAADCFHPNTKGQEEISKTLWDELPPVWN